MKLRAVAFVALSIIATPYLANGQSALQSRSVFEGDTVTRTSKGVASRLHVSVRFWEASSGTGLVAVPLRGFYVARAVGGDVRTVIDGVSVDRAPEDLWVVPAGSTMQIQAINEYASIETIAINPAKAMRRKSRRRMAVPQ